MTTPAQREVVARVLSKQDGQTSYTYEELCDRYYLPAADEIIAAYEAAAPKPTPTESNNAFIVECDDAAPPYEELKVVLQNLFATADEGQAQKIIDCMANETLRQLAVALWGIERCNRGIAAKR